MSVLFAVVPPELIWKAADVPAWLGWVLLTAGLTPAAVLLSPRRPD